MGLDLLFYKNFTHLHHFANAELKSEKKDNSEKQIKTKTPFASFVEPWVLLSLGWENNSATPRIPFGIVFVKKEPRGSSQLW